MSIISQQQELPDNNKIEQFKQIWKQDSYDILHFFNKIYDEKWHKMIDKLYFKYNPLIYKFVTKVKKWINGNKGYNIYKRLPADIQEYFENFMEIKYNSHIFYQDTIKLLKCASNEWRYYCSPREDKFDTDSAWLGHNLFFPIKGTDSFKNCVDKKNWCNCNVIGEWNRSTSISMDNINKKNCNCHLIHNSRKEKKTKLKNYEFINTSPFKTGYDARVNIAICKCKASAVLRRIKTVNLSKELKRANYLPLTNDCILKDQLFYLGKRGLTETASFLDCIKTMFG